MHPRSCLNIFALHYLLGRLYQIYALLRQHAVRLATRRQFRHYFKRFLLIIDLQLWFDILFHVCSYLALGLLMRVILTASRLAHRTRSRVLINNKHLITQLLEVL